MNTTTANCSESDHLNHTIQGLYTVIYSLNFLLGLPLNSYILTQITNEIGLASEFFTINLTLCEIIFSFKSPLILLKYYAGKDNLDPVLEFFDGFNGMGRPLFQTCICVERYLAVLHPILFLKYKQLRYRLACSTAAWLIIFGCCSVSMAVYKHVFGLYMSLYAILFFGKLLSCVMILRALRNPGPGDGKTDREKSSQVKIRAFKIIFVITVSTVVNYVSLLLLVPLQVIVPECHFRLTIAICMTVSIATGLTQPFLYLHRAGKLPCIKDF